MIILLLRYISNDITSFYTLYQILAHHVLTYPCISPQRIINGRLDIALARVNGWALGHTQINAVFQKDVIFYRVVVDTQIGLVAF